MDAVSDAVARSDGTRAGTGGGCAARVLSEARAERSGRDVVAIHLVWIGVGAGAEFQADDEARRTAAGSDHAGRFPGNIVKVLCRAAHWANLGAGAAGLQPRDRSDSRCG